MQGCRVLFVLLWLRRKGASRARVAVATALGAENYIVLSKSGKMFGVVQYSIECQANYLGLDVLN